MSMAAFASLFVATVVSAAPRPARSVMFCGTIASKPLKNASPAAFAADVNADPCSATAA